MATAKKAYGSQIFIEATSSTWTTLSGATEELSATINNTTTGYDSLYIHPEVDFDGTPTDNVEVRVYSSLDGTNWVDTPSYGPLVIDKGTDPNQVEIVVLEPGPYTRIGMKQTGAVDSHNVRASYVGANRDIT